MLEAARLIRGYMDGVTFDKFWHNSEKRDAVALRISVLGESAHKIDKETEAGLPGVPFKRIRGMRNRTAHDQGAVDFTIVWAVTQQELEPLIAQLGAYFERRPKLTTENLMYPGFNPVTAPAERTRTNYPGPIGHRLPTPLRACPMLPGPEAGKGAGRQSRVNQTVHRDLEGRAPGALVPYRHLPERRRIP